MSAIFGQPPATDKDYWIARALILQLFTTKPELAATLDPHKGYPLVPKKPAGSVGPDLTRTTFAAGVTVAVICFCITALRLVYRRFVWKTNVTADDWVIIPGSLLCCAQAGVYAAQSRVGGVGKHTWDVTYEDYKHFVELLHVGNIIIFSALGVVKISIVLFFRRFVGKDSWFWRLLCDTLLALLAIYVFACIIVFVYRTNPPRYAFDLVWARHQDTWGNDLDYYPANTAFSVVHILFDFILLAMSIVILLRADFSTRKKVRVLLLFMLGCLTCAFTVLRNQTAKNQSTDTTYDTVKIEDWTFCELVLSVVIANLLSLNILFATIEDQVISLFDKMHSASRLVEPNLPEDSSSTTRAETDSRRAPASLSKLEAGKQGTSVAVD